MHPPTSVAGTGAPPGLAAKLGILGGLPQVWEGLRVGNVEHVGLQLSGLGMLGDA